MIVAWSTVIIYKTKEKYSDELTVINGYTNCIYLADQLTWMSIWK